MKQPPKIGKPDWSWKKAKHLLNRAGFGGRRDEIEACLQAGPRAALEKRFDKVAVL